MSSVTRRTAQHAFEDFGVARPEPGPGRFRHARPFLFAVKLIPRSMRMLFGESRTASWIVVAILAIFGLLLVRPVIMSLLSWHRTASVLADRRTEVAALDQRNGELRARRDYYRTDAFVAERARHYGLVRPSETSFVVRELVHPESVGRYASTQVRNAVTGGGATTPTR